MNESQSTILLISFFALRCILPLLLTLAIGFLMNRVVARWEAQEAGSPPSVTLSPRHLVTLSSSPSEGLLPLRSDDLVDCPQHRQYGLLCWLLRARNEGALPARCANCPVFRLVMARPTPPFPARLDPSSAHT